MDLRRAFSILAALACLSTAAKAGDNGKSGVTCLVGPCVGYSTNHGTQYGASCTLVDFGDGSSYPNYRQKAYLEASRYTKGKTNLKGVYDSGCLIPGARFSAILAYQATPLYSFYGFNGSATEYDPSLDRVDGNTFYNFGRDIFKAAANIQFSLVEGLKWAFGVNYMSYKIFDVPDAFSSHPMNSLYQSYLASGTIRQEEARGGKRFEMNTGFVYDTRDAFTTPSRGIWSELYLTGSPDAFRDSYRYLRLSAHFRHYIPLADNDRLTFAYHLAYQGIIAGDAPFYVQQNITELIFKKVASEGLGSKNTIRGTLSNRYIGNSYAWANLEMRIKLFSFNAFRHMFYIAANPFLDMGAITSPYRLDAERGSELYKKATMLHESAGIGGKLVMNRNFVASIEFAKPFHKEDGKMGFTLGTNYMF